MSRYQFYKESCEPEGENVIGVDIEIQRKHGVLEGLASLHPHVNPSVCWTGLNSAVLGARLTE